MENSFIKFMTSTKCEPRQFHNKVMQSWQRNVEKKKRDAPAVSLL